MMKKTQMKIYLNSEVKKEFQKLAVDMDKSMSVLLEDWIKEKLDYFKHMEEMAELTFEEKEKKILEDFETVFKGNDNR